MAASKSRKEQLWMGAALIFWGVLILGTGKSNRISAAAGTWPVYAGGAALLVCGLIWLVLGWKTKT